MRHGIACRGATHGLTESKCLACCLPPSSHIATLPKKHGGNPNPSSSMKFISQCTPLTRSWPVQAKRSSNSLQLRNQPTLNCCPLSSRHCMSSEQALCHRPWTGAPCLFPALSQGRSETMQGQAPHHYFATWWWMLLLLLFLPLLLLLLLPASWRTVPAAPRWLKRPRQRSTRAPPPDAAPLPCLTGTVLIPAQASPLKSVMSMRILHQWRVMQKKSRRAGLDGNEWRRQNWAFTMSDLIPNSYAYNYMQGPWFSLRWGGACLLNSFWRRDPFVHAPTASRQVWSSHRQRRINPFLPRYAFGMPFVYCVHN